MEITIIEKIKRLPEQTEEALRLACVGNWGLQISKKAPILWVNGCLGAFIGY